MRSFKVEAPSRSVRPPSWDLMKVLDYLLSPVFELLTPCSLRDLTHKTLFLVSLATAKRVGELQAFSRVASFSSTCAGLSYVPEFLAKTETEVRPLPRFFLFSLFKISRPAFKKSFCYVRSGLCGSILRGLQSLLIVLVDYLFLLVVHLAQCLRMVSLSFCAR